MPRMPIIYSISLAFLDSERNAQLLYVAGTMKVAFMPATAFSIKILLLLCTPLNKPLLVKL